VQHGSVEQDTNWEHESPCGHAFSPKSPHHAGEQGHSCAGQSAVALAFGRGDCACLGLGTWGLGLALGGRLIYV
jgi:hypothetical protein